MHNFINEHFRGIINKFKQFLEHKFTKFSKYDVFSIEINEIWVLCSCNACFSYANGSIDFVLTCLSLVHTCDITT